MTASFDRQKTIDESAIRFSRVLRPHRSSSKSALKIMTRFILFLFGPTATLFLFLGAWPVFGLMGLEVAGLIFALHYNHKIGSAFEAITITDAEFRLSKVDHWGKRRHWSFQAQWLRVRIDQTSKQLLCGTKGRWIVVGKFLPEDEREALCRTLTDEIRRLGAPDLSAGVHPA